MALRGAEKLIRRDGPILILETSPVGDWFDNLLKDCGYVFKRKLFFSRSTRLLWQLEPVLPK